MIGRFVVVCEGQWQEVDGKMDGVEFEYGLF